MLRPLQIWTSLADFFRNTFFNLTTIVFVWEYDLIFFVLTWQRHRLQTMKNLLYQETFPSVYNIFFQAVLPICHRFPKIWTPNFLHLAIHHQRQKQKQDNQNTSDSKQKL